MEPQKKPSPAHEPEARLAPPLPDNDKLQACEKAGLKGESLPDYANDSIPLARAYLAGLKDRYTELYIGKYEQGENIPDHELDKAQQDVSEMEGYCDQLGNREIAASVAALGGTIQKPGHEIEGHDLAQRHHEGPAAAPEISGSATGLSEALGQSLGTAQDPVNKALRGIADHVAGKVDSKSFYQRLGLQDPTQQRRDVQHEHSHEGPALDMS